MIRHALLTCVLWGTLAFGCSDQEAGTPIEMPDTSTSDTSSQADGSGPEDAANSDDTGTAADTTDPAADSGPTVCTEGVACNDGDFCTKDDRCTAGVCVGEPYDCTDDLECTLDVCDGKGGCSATLEAGNWCLILGTCVPDGGAHPDNPCLACVTPVNSLDWSENDGGTCDDGLECTASDRCKDGTCQGTESACVDGNPCTTDGCKEGEGCIHAALQGGCEDGDLCTVGDTCTNAVCIPGPVSLDCDDGDACTTDSCDPELGCVHDGDNAACDDGDPCTTGDACVLGECVPGNVPLNCDDGDPCTNAACLKGSGCVYVPNLSSCEDGDPCTVGDTCSAGECLSGVLPANCDDENPCTNDVCTALLGCEHFPALGACDDGDTCTENDSCAGGVCVGGTVAECDDGDICTDDLCDTQAGGCLYVFNAAPCDDGDPCTLGDICAEGGCASTFADCDDDNPCTFDQCAGEAGCIHEPLSTDGCLVSITINTPKRGAELTGSGSILVNGTVQSPAGAIELLEINGKPVTVNESGAFSTSILAAHGMNIISATAVDILGNTDNAVRSFYYGQQFRPMSSTNPVASKMNKGLYLVLGPQGIDDGVHDPNNVDDLATIFEVLLASFDVGALLPNPLLSNGEYDVTIGQVTFGSPSVQLTPVPTGLNLWARITNFNASINANGKCLFCPSASGNISIDEIRIITTVAITTQNGQVKATLQDPQVLLFGLDVDIDGILGSIFDFLVDFIVGQFASTIESAFEDELGSAIPSIIEDALGSLAFNTSFIVPSLFPGGTSVEIQLNTGLETTSFDDDGGLLRLWAAATTPKQIDVASKGTLLRSACLSGGGESLDLAGEQPIQLGLADDLLNQILYALWWGGGLEFPVPASLLGDVDLSEFGIDDIDLNVKFLLPPVVTACNPAQEPVVQIGDIEVMASLNLFGNPVELAIYASAQAPIEITADNTGLGIIISDIDTVETEVVVLTPGFASAEQAVESLVADQLTPALFGLLGGDALAGFPLPEIDLSGLVAGIPAGTTLAVNPTVVDRELGWTIVRGSIQ